MKIVTKVFCAARVNILKKIWKSQLFGKNDFDSESDVKKVLHQKFKKINSDIKKKWKIS